MPNKLDQLRAMSTVVADTGDMDSIRAYKPTDATTNPSLILKAAQMPHYAQLVEEAIVWGRRQGARVGDVTDRSAPKLIAMRTGTAGGGPYTPETDPGVESVREIYTYYKAYGIKTVVMGASFRNTGEIEALAGCDRLTISPELLEALSKEQGDLPRRLDPAHIGPAPAKIAMDEQHFRWM